MLSLRLSPSGRFTAQEAGTRTYSAKPPSVLAPRSKPVRTTSSPAAKSPAPLSTTVPAASMPGVWGKLRVTPLLPEADSASL